MVSRSMRSFVTGSGTVEMGHWSVVASPSGLSAPVSLPLNQILRDKTLKWVKFIHFTNKWKCYGPRELFVWLLVLALFWVWFLWAFAPILFHWFKFNQWKLFLSTIHFDLLKWKICLYGEDWIWLYRWETLSLAYSPSKEDPFCAACWADLIRIHRADSISGDKHKKL